MNYLIFNKIDSGKKRIRTRRYGRDGYGKKGGPSRTGTSPVSLGPPG